MATLIIPIIQIMLSDHLKEVTRQSSLSPTPIAPRWTPVNTRSPAEKITSVKMADGEAHCAGKVSLGENDTISIPYCQLADHEMAVASQQAEGGIDVKAFPRITISEEIYDWNK